jgi:diguanylate cyclase (GGDEF)-like protein/PAS domain S-box-containing protein
MPANTKPYARQVWITVAALLALVLAFIGYAVLEKRVDAAHAVRHRSFLLADELRQSSDDLTRMARTFVVTGEPRWRDYFFDIVDIRDGRLPRPERYQQIYWDWVSAGRLPRPSARDPGVRVPLLTLMREAGFTAAEFEALSRAKAESDALTVLEHQAMDLVRQAPAQDEAARARARTLMHDAHYHAVKAAIMAPIDQVFQSMDARTLDQIRRAERDALWGRVVVGVLAALMVAMLLLTRRTLRVLMGGPVAEVHARISRLGRGDFSLPPVGPRTRADSVLGHLAQTGEQLRQMAAEQRRSQAQLKLAAGVFTHAREGIMITDAEGLIVDVNDAFLRLTGYRRDEVIGYTPRLLDSGVHDDDFFHRMWAQLQREGQWHGEVHDRAKDGTVFVVLETISAVRDEHGQITHFVTLMNDITRLKEQEQRLAHIAHFDALTGLPNRVLLGDRLQQALAQAPRRGHAVGVAYLDLDGFKAVNDRHGHETGDRLLVALAERLKQSLREGDTLARLGGDEFVVVFPDLPEAAASQPLVDRLLRAASQPVALGEVTAHVSASIGVTHFPQAEEVDADQLLRQADQAIYEAKVAGKNRVVVFDADADRELRGQSATVESLRQALREQQLVLHYQPKVNMGSGLVVGVEALIRWQHPEHGLLPPAQFLPAIEDHPIEIDIGEWVIRSALAQLAAWTAEGLSLSVSVNISARHLQQVEFIERVAQALQAHPQLQPSQLVLEVLETSALEDMVGVSRTMAEGERRGLRFSLDDFGTGYSSLTYLRRLPVAELKIDQSFVRDMLDDPDDLAILHGVIGLAEAFHREVVAEGVESEEHGTVLLQLGCTVAQGYGIARPMPADQLRPWLQQWQPPSAWRHQALMRREDLPLLRAKVEYGAWIRSLELYLLGQRDLPPSMSQQDEWLRAWLRVTAGDDALGGRPLMQRHDRLMRLAHDAMRARERAPRGLPPEGLEAVQAAHLRVLELLQAQMRAREVAASRWI